MKLEIIDNHLYLDNEIASIATTKTPKASYPSYGFNDKHYDFKYSKCKVYTFFHNEIKNMKLIHPSDFIEGLYLDCFDFEQEGLLGLYKHDQLLYASMKFDIQYEDWDENFSLKEFLLKFKELIRHDKRFHYSVDEFGLIVFVREVINETEEIVNIIQKIKNLYSSIFNAVLSSNGIESSIIFRPEHFTAGTSILQYFGKLLQDKYPNENVSVSIKQEGLKVSMTIETPDGKKEEVEEYLNKFGMVITNQMSPQEFTSNPIQVLELETKLSQAEQEIGFQKKLLALQDKTYDENLVSLKDEVKYLREELSALRVSNNENIQMLLQSLQIKDKLVNKLTKAINSKNQEETKALLLELKEKDSKGYTSLKEHLDSFMIGSLTNTPSWIQFAITHFPK